MTAGAATNTLREARAWLWREAENDAPPHGWRAREEVISNLDSAIALVEAALDAAEGVMTQMDYETPHHTRLREALAALGKQPA